MTTITIPDEQDTMVIKTCNNTLIRRLNMLCAEYPQFFTLTVTDGTKVYKCNRKYLHIAKPSNKKLSAEDKQKMQAGRKQ